MVSPPDRVQIHHNNEEITHPVSHSEGVVREWRESGGLVQEMRLREVVGDSSVMLVSKLG